MLVPVAPPDESLKRLQMLHSTREFFVKQRTALKISLKEYKCIVNKRDCILQTREQLIKSFDKQIVLIEKEMEALVKAHPAIKNNFDLLITIKGIGQIIALAAIVKTKNFTAFANARKFCCYCGTAPFEHSSGTSIKKRTRVDHKADKRMKTLLDQAAKSAIQFDPELRLFYLRRTESGKSKMSTINIVRNKIIYRMFAVIKRQTPFIENYLQAA